MPNNVGIDKVCFACTTSYQIMNAISIVYSDSLNADIFIFDTFKGYKQIAEKLENAKIFKEVYVVPFYSSKKYAGSKNLMRISCMWSFVRATQYIRKFIPEYSFYDKIYVSSQAIPKMVLKRALEKWNPNLVVVIYEDGMGTYVQGGHALNGSGKFQFLQKLLKFEFRPNGRTIFMPRLPQIAPPLERVSEYKIVPMMPVPYKKLRNLFYDIFGTEEKIETINEKVIVFDYLRLSYNEDTHALDIMYDIIYKQYPQDSICKLHPRSKVEIKSQIKIYSDTQIPIEMLYMDMDDLEERVIVSVFSTASFTPILMFGKSPVLILLYKMFLEKERVIEYDKLLNKIMQVYESKIYTPCTISEFEECLALTKE